MESHSADKPQVADAKPQEEIPSANIENAPLPKDVRPTASARPPSAAPRRVRLNYLSTCYGDLGPLSSSFQ